MLNIPLQSSECLRCFLQHHCKTGVLIIGKMKPSFVFIYFDCLVLITAEIYWLWVRDITLVIQITLVPF